MNNEKEEKEIEEEVELSAKNTTTTTTNNNTNSDNGLDLIVDDIINLSEVSEESENENKIRHVESNISMKSSESIDSNNSYSKYKKKKAPKVKLIHMKGLSDVENKDEVDKILEEYNIKVRKAWILSHAVYVEAVGKTCINRLLQLELYRNERKVKIFVDTEQSLQYDLFKTYTKNDDIDLVKELIQSYGKYFPPDHTTKHGRTLLMVAAAAGAPKVTKYLLSYGCDANAADIYGLTCLMHAARASTHEGLQVVRSLIKAGADVSIRDQNNWSVCDHASRGGNIDIVKYVLKYWLRPSDGGRIALERDREDWHKIVAAGTRGKAIQPIEDRQQLHPSIEHDGMPVLHLLIQARPEQTLHALILNLHWTRKQVTIACRNSLINAKSPILLSLKIAEAAHNLTPLALSYQKELKKLYDDFTTTAIELVEELHSDHFVAWSLEASSNGIHDNYDSIMDVALRSKNRRFLTTSRVQRVLNFWWESTWFGYFDKFGFLKTQYPMGNFDSVLKMLIEDPLRAFNVPKLNYSIRVISFMIWVFLVSYMTYQRPRIDDSFDTMEWILYIYTFGFLIDEWLQFYTSISVYAYIVENQADLVLYTAAILTFICRIRNIDSSDMFRLYLISSSVWVIMIWIRLIYTCRHFDTMQSIITLLIVLQNMFIDIRNFVSLLIIAMIGFFFAFRFVTGSVSISGFENDGYTFLTLYSAAVSADFDFGNLQELNNDEQTIAQLLAVVYVGVSAIVLINMLIAMLSYTFENVVNSSTETVLFERVKHTWSYAKSDDHVIGQVPPFNILIILFRIIMKPMLWLRQCLQNSDDDEWMCSWCGNLPVQHRKNKLLKKTSAQSPLEHIVSCLTFILPDKEKQETSKRWITEQIGYGICGECLHMRHTSYNSDEIINLFIANLTYYIYIVFVYVPAYITIKPIWYAINGWYLYLDWYRKSRTGYVDPMSQGLHAFGRSTTFNIKNKNEQKTNDSIDEKSGDLYDTHKFSSDYSLASELADPQTTNNVFQFVSLSGNQIAKSIIHSTAMDARLDNIERNLNILIQKKLHDDDADNNEIKSEENNETKENNKSIEIMKQKKIISQ